MLRTTKARALFGAGTSATWRIPSGVGLEVAGPRIPIPSGSSGLRRPAALEVTGGREKGQVPRAGPAVVVHPRREPPASPAQPARPP
jgi:hypothetical protein